MEKKDCCLWRNIGKQTGNGLGALGSESGKFSIQIYHTRSTQGIFGTTIKINREVVTIRGIIPGEWIVNSHYYSPYNNFLNKDYSITVRVELHRVTPYKILWVGDKTFTRRGQEETFIRFTIDKEGELVGPFNFREKFFTGPRGIRRTNSAPSGISNSNNNASGLP